jgi:cell division septation protein DedD
MINTLKSTWWIFLLIIAGGVIFFLGLHPPKTQVEQGVVLNDIFHQQIMRTEESPSAAAAAKKNDPVPPMAIVTSPINGHETGITIQVYSFQDKNRAANALQALQNNGYSAFLVMSDLGEKGVWYRVRIGGIPDEAAAHKMLDEIRKTYNSGFIVKK